MVPFRCALAALAFAGAAGCTARATVTQATPMASLRSYGSVLVRVGYNPNTPSASTQLSTLEWLTADRLRKKCRFERVIVASQEPDSGADLIMDLNIQNLFRGADPAQGGLLKIDSSSQATADVAVVLSDGINDDLIGSAQIRGKSAAMSGSPEAQAMTAVADKLAQIMGVSGCAAERIARAPEPKEPPADPPPTDGTDPAPAISEEDLARAEALNDEGKALFRQANAVAAAAKFEEALQVVDDPRFRFNLCLAYEAENNFEAAIKACERVRDSGASDRLSEKAAERLDIIRAKTGGNK